MMSVTRDSPTLLVMEGLGVMPYSALGLTQTLDPIDDAAHLERTINGELIDFSYLPMRKYKSTISGSDQRPPSTDGKWPGTLVEIDCIATLCHREYEEFDRAPVNNDDAIIYEGGFVVYRPRLTMRVKSFTTQHDEYGAVVSWTLELEEV